MRVHAIMRIVTPRSFNDAGRGGRMTEGDGAAIIERFRQAAFGMADWTDGIGSIARATGSHVGQLAVMSQQGGLAANIVTGVGPDAIAAYFEARGDDPAVNPRTRALLASAPLRCMIDDDFVTADMRATLPIYRNLFRWLDVPYGMQMRLDTASDYATGLVLLRSRSQGAPDDAAIALLDSVATCIAGAIAAGLQLGMDRDAGVLSTAETLSGAGILLGRDLRIMSMSPVAEAIVRTGRHLTVRAGRLRPAHAWSARTLEGVCRAAITPHPAANSLRPVTLLTADGDDPLLVDICPLPARAAGPLSLAQALLTIRLPRPLPDPDATISLRHAFGLTAAEAGVASLLVHGCNLATIAARRGSTVGTIRAQLKSIFTKTYTCRQVELVARLRDYC